MTIHLNQGHFAAIVLFLGMILWVASGSLGPEQEFSNPRPLVMETGLKRVQVERMQGQATQRDVLVSAHTAANRRVELRSEIRAKVVRITKAKGEMVKKGDVLVELDARDWPARLKQAKASLKQRQLEAQSAQKLFNKDLANEAQLAQAQTALANAEAEMIQARIQVNATKIRAPFDGIVDQRMVEVGDFVKDSQAIITVLDFSPYLVVGNLPEIETANVHIGDPGYAILVDGSRVDGKIRFVAAEADSQTRTFPVELEIDNPSGVMTSGLTAKIHVPQPETHAYHVSPALLILSDDGQLGLKGIDEQHKVVFRPISLLKADNDGVWVYGLGEQADIITVGQGFVEYGEQVEPVFVSEEMHSETSEPTSQPAADEQTALTAG
ncbi:efflux RND transporter periplasmic adaptor subunit [Bacterioplanoides sp.]|uniref:efflux RND transporter periplasmic adaptor subunit n=1 Tax=Bacterioplanoides sp. TaxID=2066072 RepID=UPI003B5BAD0B